MCLISKEKEGMVAEKPITCYKIYRKGEGGTMEAYYTGVKYDVEEGDEVIAEGHGDIKYHVGGFWDKSWTLEKGFIHAERQDYSLLKIGLDMWNLFLDILGAMEDNLDVDKELDTLLKELKELCWCEMEIPAGERYWNGIYGDVCAKRMIFKKDITPRKKSALLMVIDRCCVLYVNLDKIKAKLPCLIEKYKKEEEE